MPTPKPLRIWVLAAGLLLVGAGCVPTAEEREQSVIREQQHLKNSIIFIDMGDGVRCYQNPINSHISCVFIPTSPVR